MSFSPSLSPAFSLVSRLECVSCAVCLSLAVSVSFRRERESCCAFRCSSAPSPSHLTFSLVDDQPSSLSLKRPHTHSIALFRLDCSEGENPAFLCCSPSSSLFFVHTCSRREKVISSSSFRTLTTCPVLLHPLSVCLTTETQRRGHAVTHTHEQRRTVLSHLPPSVMS